MTKKPKRPESMIKLGATLRKLRESQAMTQDELARRSRLHRNYIGGIERAERNITILSLMRVAEGLETKASRVLADSGL